MRGHIQGKSEGRIQPPPMAVRARCCDSHVMTAATPVKVFLAEDSALIRDRVAAMLAAEALDVVGQAESASDSIAGIRAAQPDVVVLDVQLAGGSGLEVLRAVRATDPDVAFVVFTLNAAPAYRRRYLEEGAGRFLDKAAEFGQLAGAVRVASHRHH